MVARPLPAIRRPSAFDICRLLFVGAIWGSTFIFVAFALEDFGPVSIAAWRVALGALIMLAIVLAMRQRFPLEGRYWKYVFIIGLLNSAIPFYLISWGQQFISSAETAILLASGTFCSLLVSHFTSLDERINRYRAAGVLIGFSGVVVLMWWDMLASGFGGIQGQIAVTLAGCSYAVSSVIARRVSHLPAIPTSAATLLSACCYMLPLAFIFENPLPSDASMRAILSLLIMGVVATALAMTIRLAIIRANGAVFMAQVGYLVPVFGVLWSALVFADVLNTQTIIALSLILLGIAVARKGHS